MNSKTIGLLELPDEILLIIFDKLGSVNVLYSLLNSTQRLDQIARNIDYTKSINFSIELSDGQFTTIDPDKLHRFCVEILPQINHHIQAMTLETVTIERILLATQFPNLNTIVLVGCSPDVLLRHFTEESSIAHLLKEQMKNITVKIGNEMFNDISYTNVCGRILSICGKCTYLDMNQLGNTSYSRLSFDNRSEKICYSSYLHTLSIYVKTFDDCLCLFDGRLNNLSSVTVRVTFIEISPTITDSLKKLPNLTAFSLTCYGYTIAYDNRIVPLLCRMINLKKLTLCLNIIRLTVIDRDNLNEKFLRHMSNLDTYIFHICTILPTSPTNYSLSTKNIEKTFSHWKYSQVGCSIDHFSDGYTYCHIYSIPFQMTCFMYLTNNICKNHYFQFVISLILLDTHPFEHDFFEWMSRAIPLLKYLTLDNFIPQVKKLQNKPIEDKSCISSTISYNHLVRLRLTHAHMDYVYQFLCHTKAYIPQLRILKIQYDKLVTVTNNFTNDATQINCNQLKQLIFDELIVYPEHFDHYFPCLNK